jgi:endonuclease/exonuclease/phosphatase family metal-dependent hydrolase
MSYNVEMLFDVDGVSLLDDYAATRWGPLQLSRKLDGIAQVLKRAGAPDVICFNEFEADRTPESAVADLGAFLAAWRGPGAKELLEGAAPLSPERAGLPVEAWLARRMADEGLTGYQVAVGRWREDPTGHVVFHTNVVFSRFPILSAHTHDTDGARGILEVQLQIGGSVVHVFNNHWKSGASDPTTEPVRIGNAAVLRARLDEILRDDPQADAILAGDFNSQYNQKQRYPQMPRTAINDVLGSQGDEAAVATLRGPALYNLWFELPPEKRASDEYQDEWGTLMQILVSRGLYDDRGVQYEDNSFRVAAYPKLNAERASGRPVRWTFAGGGRGYSDHFPIVARFRAGPNVRPMTLKNPSRTPDGPAAAVPVMLPLDRAIDLARWPRGREFRTEENLGEYFRTHATVTSAKPLKVRLDGSGIEIVVWIHDRAKREAFIARHAVGAPVSFVGELGQFRGEWQLVIPASTLP